MTANILKWFFRVLWVAWAIIYTVTYEEGSLIEYAAALAFSLFVAFLGFHLYKALFLTVGRAVNRRRTGKSGSQADEQAGPET